MFILSSLLVLHELSIEKWKSGKPKKSLHDARHVCHSCEGQKKGKSEVSHTYRTAIHPGHPPNQLQSAA
jgi:hypothetical protein